jgi:hypothetical protein
MNERLDLIDRQVVLLIDEIDLANEDASEFDDSEIEERRQINRVLQQLRGLIQVRNDRGAPHLSFICAGVAASIFTQAVRFDRENQLFGFASARTLGSMPPSEMREMVRTLGKRSGVQFRHPDLFDMLYREYGGHPHLTRQACAVVAESLSSDAAHAVPYSVTHSDLNQAFLQVGEGSPAFAAWQTLESFARWYPGEGALVRDLSNGKLVQLDPTSASHAVGFGLCDKEGTLKMRALARLGVTVR